jgi:hypothetical protein
MMKGNERQICRLSKCKYKNSDDDESKKLLKNNFIKLYVQKILLIEVEVLIVLIK